MYNQLDSYITKLQILKPNQYGFRNNHSTHLAIIDMCKNVSKSLYNGQTVLGIFIDLSKAFDIINNNILLDTLNFVGSWCRTPMV